MLIILSNNQLSTFSQFWSQRIIMRVRKKSLRYSGKFFLTYSSGNAIICEKEKDLAMMMLNIRGYDKKIYKGGT